ncbi:uncharacterized protein LOC103848580 [Brassica rapa]|uniref:uncharacterized protein LOC103848580 n=1 Tax=Brassica campestris TaxID=3711 RepID=UPI0004F17D0D|nr:uncharacterized protein LOC103848580 [Brassica rapa]XP_013650480.1 uncharacterized protein LOC106354997 [Brassica napus]
MVHLKRLEDLVSATKANGVPEDYLFCKLFKYSLAREALHWLKQLPPRSLTSWADIKNAFLRNFFDESLAEELRSKIATFTQEPPKSFRSTWIRFKSYQRNCPHHGFNEVQLLSTFFKGIALAYQMALETTNEENFNTGNPEEVVRLIDNLASSNSTKNTDFERRKLATLGKEELDDVQAKLDSVHKLLKKQVSFSEDMEGVEINGDGDLEENVNFISCTGFPNQKPWNQKHGNQNGYRNCYGNIQRSNFNHNSQFEKPYNNNNRSYGNSSYQNVSLQTRESKIEAMIDQVLEGQQKLMVNFNGKIDVVYTELNAKFETLNTHVKKLETQVVQTREAVKKQETFIKGNEALKYHVNAIIEDDF